MCNGFQQYVRQIGFGKAGCPFDCHHYDRRDEYQIPELPNSKKLQNEEYIGFFQIGWPNTIDDMDIIIKGIHKVMANKERLKNEEIHSSKNFISGR